jgi:uncharacterized DUF497 family protein
MSQVRFEWDPKKAKSNEKKHGVSFEEARSVFFDEQALLQGRCFGAATEAIGHHRVGAQGDKQPAARTLEALAGDS